MQQLFNIEHSDHTLLQKYKIKIKKCNYLTFINIIKTEGSSLVRRFFGGISPIFLPSWMGEIWEN